MIRPPSFEVHEETVESTLYVSVSGELDLKTVEILGGRLASKPHGECDGLTLDLREVPFMDSSGVRFLIELNERSIEERWKLSLIAPRHDGATLVLEATGADDALPFRSEGPS